MARTSVVRHLHTLWLRFICLLHLHALLDVLRAVSTYLDASVVTLLLPAAVAGVGPRPTVPRQVKTLYCSSRLIDPDLFLLCLSRMLGCSSQAASSNCTLCAPMSPCGWCSSGGFAGTCVAGTASG